MIVDRDSMSSDLLAQALMRDGQCEAVGLAPGDLLKTLASHSVDLVIIAAELDSVVDSGFELAHSVSKAHPEISIIMLLNRSDSESVINAFRAGSRGVFSRQQTMSEFLDCVEHVRRGFIWAGRDETNELLQVFRNMPAPRLVTAVNTPTLTARELQVVQYAAKGKTNRTIALELGLSEHTVKNYLFRAFEKLGVSSRVELLFYLTIRGHAFGSVKAADAEQEGADTDSSAIKSSVDDEE